MQEDVQVGVLSTHLLRIAHESLRAFVLHQQSYEPSLDQFPSPIQGPGSSFVTLYHRGQLRGCIGSTERRYPLALDVARNAAAAARDPRFPPVLPREVPDIRLEVTVLQPPRLLAYDNYKDLLGKLRPGIDGVIISWKKRRALLLPQVWARIPEPAGFLHALCHKAQIPQGLLWAVPPRVRVMIFEALTYKENDDTIIERK